MPTVPALPSSANFHPVRRLPQRLTLLLSAVVLMLPLTVPAQNTSPASAGAASASAKAALTVTTAQPRQTQLAQRLAANGNVAAWQEATVGSQVQGLRLSEVLVNVGDVVQAGQVLAVFASDEVQADLAQAKAAVAEASATLEDASANAARARSLQDSGALSAQQIGQYLTAEAAARARLQSAQAVLLQQELRLRNTRVLAPDAGTISARMATVGAVTGAGSELFRLIRRSRLEWRAEVTANELGAVRPGTRAQIALPTGGSVEGRVRIVAPTVDPQTRTALVYVDLPNPGRLLAGMFARGEFVLGETSARTVPQQAVVVRDGFHYVFSVGKELRVTQHKVEVGRRVGDQVEILRGLPEATAVAVQGAAFLNDGDTVRVNNAAASQ